MTNKKEQARKLREAADAVRSIGGRNNIVLDWLDNLANELDPPVKERWEQVRDAANALGVCATERYWKAALVEANKGMVSKDELKRLAPWFSGAAGSGFSPRDYNQGIAAFLRVLDSL